MPASLDLRRDYKRALLRFTATAEATAKAAAGADDNGLAFWAAAALPEAQRQLCKLAAVDVGAAKGKVAWQDGKPDTDASDPVNIARAEAQAAVAVAMRIKRRDKGERTDAAELAERLEASERDNRRLRADLAQCEADRDFWRAAAAEAKAGQRWMAAPSAAPLCDGCGGETYAPGLCSDCSRGAAVLASETDRAFDDGAGVPF